MATTPAPKHPWRWIPSLYFAEGLPYMLIMIVSTIMYKRLGISNTDLALYTSWLYIPWMFKWIWSPFVDIFKTKRWWTLTMQLILGASLACIGLTIPGPEFFKYSLIFFWLMAFSSATHDIAADGFYMIALDEGNQSFFVGIRSFFYRLAMLTGQGLLVILAGTIESSTGLPAQPIVIQAVETAEQPRLLEIDSIVFDQQENHEGIWVMGPSELPLNNLPAAQADSLIQLAKQRNLAVGVVRPTAAAQSSDTSPSWWSTHVSTPLGAWIKANFGEQEISYSKAHTGLAFSYLRLAAKPAEDSVVVHISLDQGDNTIKLIEGNRLVFNQTNWDQPATLVFRQDPNLNQPNQATFQATSGNTRLAWQMTFFLSAILMLGLAFFHRWAMPKVETEHTDTPSGKQVFRELGAMLSSFFRRPKIWAILAFILLYRFAEGQLAKIASPFLLDARELGGLGLTTAEVGFVYGGIGVLGLITGGILGGYLVSRDGLKKWLWWMVLAINLPNLVYVYLSLVQPSSMIPIGISVVIEQFGYGFGFTAMMMYLIYVAKGPYKTAHYAFGTGIMAMGMWIPGMLSGWMQELVGYGNFFIWVVIATVPAFLATAFIPLEADFGKKEASAE
ncbi:MFS transporter [Pontibacter sp. G13]|uniref:MFS transporter n=1 Tax=Pontibacter sp. G13 TaxID=3074898 RepID=UPI00288A6A51|nr:MFS transporter [Pontibacter sp. G13]WNJ16968.1 MFS transporter [Pontibacter sp. G13]